MIGEPPNMSDYDAFPSGGFGGTRLITLTTAAAVHVAISEWPAIAGELEREYGEPGSEDERAVWLRVRGHIDGSMIVYGKRIGPITISGGEIVPAGGDVVVAILRLGRLLAAPQHLANRLIDCIADGLRARLRLIRVIRRVKR